MLKLARPRLTSLVADTAEAAILPVAAIEHRSRLLLVQSKLDRSLSKHKYFIFSVWNLRQ